MNRLKSYFAQSAPPRYKNPALAGLTPNRPLGWVRFIWDLNMLPKKIGVVPEHYQIVRATAEDDAALRKIFTASYMLDPVWSPAIGEVMRKIQAWLDAAQAEDRICVALRHGARIIGAALLHVGGASEDQLAPGPTISLEYRNRGFGTLLLEHSLRTLREVGLERASGITRDISPAAKFVYPKFGGVGVSLGAPVLAAV